MKDMDATGLSFAELVDLVREGPDSLAGWLGLAEACLRRTTPPISSCPNDTTSTGSTCCSTSVI